MIRLLLWAEFQDAETVEEAEKHLDDFREAVQPSSEWAISLFRFDDQQS